MKRVNQDSAAMGLVVSIEDSYVIEPICMPWPGLHNSMFCFVDEDTPSHTECGSSCHPTLPSPLSHPRAHNLLYNIPGSELKRSEDHAEGDYVIFRDWLGHVAAIDVDVAVLLDNQSVVWVEKPWELYYLIPDDGIEIVALPERYQSIRLPEVDPAKYHSVGFLPPEDFDSGQFVVTNRRNLRNGRWLHGKYDQSVEPVGRVFDVRTRRLEVQWLCPNPYSDDTHIGNVVEPPSASVRPYENLSSFRHPRNLRRSKDLTAFDLDRQVSRRSTTEDRILAPWNQDLKTDRYIPVSTGRDFRVGDRVRWLDPTAAKVKYQPISVDSYGCFRPINRADTFNFDLNEFRVISTKLRVKVLWQDQTMSKHESTSLRNCILLEQPLFPGDIVSARESMKMTPLHDPYGILCEYNEMMAFEHNYILRPGRTGVVQSVDARDQVARVKWFGEPQIAIMNADTVLRLDSRLGAIAASLEDVSLYEIMNHQVFDCRRGDIVIIKSDFARRNLPGACAHLSVRQIHGSPRLLSQINEGSADTLVSELRRSICAPPDNAPFRPNVNAPKNVANDTSSHTWVAQVMDIHLDGNVTVRLLAAKQCCDVVVHRDDIALTIDVAANISGLDFVEAMEAMEAWGYSDDMDLDDSDAPSPIDEDIEYDGGDRMDDESDDEGWLTDEEAISSLSEALLESKATDIKVEREVDRPRSDNSPFTPKHAMEITLGKSQDQRAGNQVDRKSELRRYLLRCPPAAFEVLTREPPPDQFRASQPSTAGSSLLKRLRREHRILASSLPTKEIYVRTYESRLDLMRCLIVGPENTPYEYAPFIIDLHLGQNFPREPPTAHFHSWTHGLGRINPNLYEEGKICLSLLGTWQGTNDTESWSEEATILQILVSLQGLVLVKEPYYNEAGFETMQEERANLPEAMLYSEKAFVIARGFVSYALSSPVQGLEEILAWLYMPAGENSQDAAQCSYLQKIVWRAQQLIQSSEDSRKDSQEVLFDGKGGSANKENTFLKPLSKGAIVMLKKAIFKLEDTLRSLEAQQPDVCSTRIG